MKAILISIKPKWVVKILNGEKTIEIRKTMPKCDLPIDVYIYCTKDKKDYLCKPNEWGMPFPKVYALGGKCCKNYNGKVVAKFTLNKVEKILEHITNTYMSYCTNSLSCDEFFEKSCLIIGELEDYLNLNNGGYAWHISNLEIFEPKDLSEFETIKQQLVFNGQVQPIFQNIKLTKAPESWCYVESE